MFGLIQAMNPGHRKPNLDHWANDIRLMREQDHRTDEDIRLVFGWANADSFWRTNILSPGKLRDQFDMLNLKRKTPALSSHYDAGGRICYRLEDAGWKILQNGRAAERKRLLTVASPEESPEAWSRFEKVHYAEIAARRSWNDEAARGELGCLPWLSCSLPNRRQLCEFHENQAKKATT